MSQLQFPSTRNSKKTHIHTNKFVHLYFVWDDAVKKTLSSNYQGPYYKVLHKSDKYFTIQKVNNSDTLAIDKLKPAFLEKQTQPHTFFWYTRNTQI